MTDHAGCVKFIFKILDFYDVKLYAFVKLANLETISKKRFFNLIFFRQTYIYIFA